MMVEGEVVMVEGEVAMVADDGVKVGEEVVMVEEDEVQALPVPPGDGPLQKMVVSGNGRFVAAFTHDGRLAVYSTRFEKMFEYQCEV